MDTAAPTTPRIVPPGQGELIGDAPDRRVEILTEQDRLHVTWSRFGPGRDGASLHIHHHHTDLFYVLAGEFTVRLGVDGHETTLPAGSLAHIPPPVVHGFRNASDAELRFLNLHAPGSGFAAYLRGMRDRRPVEFDQHDPPDRDERPVADVTIARHGPVLADSDAIAVSEVTLTGGERTGAAESLYVLEGEVVVGEGAAAPAGSWVDLPAGARLAGDGARVLRIRAGCIGG